jgi:hypothetical protein
MTTLVLNTGLLKIDDIVTDEVTDDDLTRQRNVLLTAVDLDDVLYRGEWMPVAYVTGTDLHTHKPVKWLATPRRKWTASRA